MILLPKKSDIFQEKRLFQSVPAVLKTARNHLHSSRLALFPVVASSSFVSRLLHQALFATSQTTARFPQRLELAAFFAVSYWQHGTSLACWRKRSRAGVVLSLARARVKRTAKRRRQGWSQRGAAKQRDAVARVGIGSDLEKSKILIRGRRRPCNAMGGDS